MVVNEDTHGGLSVLGFTKSGVCCCDCAWLRKATDNGEVNEGNANRSKKRPAAAGLFLDSGDSQPTTPYLLCYSACATGKKEFMTLS
jgi:hypothetical protein